MAGAVIRVVPKTFVSFTNIPANPAQETVVWLARRIDVSQWKENVLYIRLHGAVIGTGSWGLTPTLQVYHDGYTEEDPSIFSTLGGQAAGASQFVAAVASGNVALTTGATAFYSLQPFGLPSNLGGSIALALRCKQGTSAQTADIPISIDLSGKD